VSESELSLVVASITGAGRQQVIHDEPTRAGNDLAVKSLEVVTGVIVVVATQTTQLALQHAPWRHLTDTYTIVIYTT